ncbi:fumarylacetoacetate hydrolase family protein [Sciscionella sediminilitoris]|uniref:fumarylacetoacetate hydrolase family protein n=1 Tax=Sciscionella sediminilitoris TaxID=1445613 RepID=UPI0004DF7455|nr:fumarylacetoacetate hydrolase family protein [Sciscionella sp. SE31]
MKFLRIGPVGAERPVVARQGRYFDLRPVTAEVDASFLAALDVARIAEAELPEIDIRGERIGAPIARPGAVVCIGMNYAAHAAESGAAPPSEPVVFYKAPNTVVGPEDEVLLPRGSTKTDWEVELGVVIGSRARYLESPEQALDHVAGYTVSNDVSERAFQLELSGGQWSKGKSCETFNPLGPWLVSADEIPDPQALRLRSAVNGRPRQDSSTADMIFSVATLIHRLSQVMVLEPGDLLNTGTPEGVALSGRFPYLAAGDVMSCAIDGLGEQRQRLRPA